MLNLDTNGPPLLTIFGNKITIYRRLAQSALEKLAPFLPNATGVWTAGVAMPGGDFLHDGVNHLIAKVQALHPWLQPAEALRRVRTYGTGVFQILAGAKSRADLAHGIGAILIEAEVRWQMAHEWARRAEDVVWRRTKLGLRMTPAEIATLDAFMIAAKG